VHHEVRAEIRSKQNSWEHELLKKITLQQRHEELEQKLKKIKLK